MNIPPQKPWESGGGNAIGNSRPLLSNTAPQIQSTYQNIPSRPILQSSSPYLSGNIRTVGPAPPLPPRPNTIHYPVQRSYAGGYGISPYSSYGVGGYGGYNNYGGFNSYGGLSGYGGYRMSDLSYGYGRPMNDFESRFIQLAEESSRPAFQSIESIVQSFSSVSMMLESTFHAMHSSFRAVIGVAENFSRLWQMFAQFFSAIAILRFAQNYLRRLLYWFGVIREDPGQEMLWQRAQNDQSQLSVTSSFSTWPVFAFLGVLFGGPYLMSKFFGQSVTNSENTWNPQEEPGYSIVAIHPFQAASNSEISFQRGQMLQLAPSHYYNVEASSGWLLAADLEGRVGFIPSNRVARVTNHHVPPVNTTHVNQPVNTAVPVWSETANSKSEENVACPVPSGEAKTEKQ